jgi:hypothetical protein
MRSEAATDGRLIGFIHTEEATVRETVADELD